MNNVVCYVKTIHGVTHYEYVSIVDVDRSIIEEKISSKFKCLYCHKLGKWDYMDNQLICHNHPVFIKYGFAISDVVNNNFKLRYFAFHSKLSMNNFRAIFRLYDQKFLLFQQLGNRMNMDKVLEFDFFPEVFPDNVSDKVKNYLLFS